MNEKELQEVIQHARDRAIEEQNNQPWYQKNLDVALPLFIIAIGLFQFVLRKWILPVSKDIVFELEDQFPSQGLIYHPGFGVFLTILGAILLVAFNFEEIF
ncbi:MAG: hypothetical protein AMJ53_06005 [Gammaproteobacteria bacterium SG8_11]|nr:MAG: hypothetical protein AMJ53_06005 [Gammaproteobacteria bacterium SG8_11]